MVALILNLITCYCLANFDMLKLGVRDREKMTSRDMGKATLGLSKNRDIPGFQYGTRVYTFKHFRVEELRQRCNTSHWRDRKIYLKREYFVGKINPPT